MNIERTFDASVTLVFGEQTLSTFQKFPGPVVVGPITVTINTGGDTIRVDTAGQPDTQGTQVVDLSGTRTAGFLTGLANDATLYTASVNVDGSGAQAISIMGSAAQTYAQLLTELQADTTGALWSIEGGNIVCRSNSYSTTSTIAIIDVDLFAALTRFVAISAAVPGEAGVWTAWTPGAVAVDTTAVISGQFSAVRAVRTVGATGGNVLTISGV